MKLRVAASLAVFVVAAASLSAQFTLQDSGTTADLRGIVNVGDGNAWASGTHGTVLRTEDGGFVWQGCAVPPGAQDLDFRGIQAFDDQTAIVMSSGKGALSRVYKTTDGCKSWKLVFTDPDADGFFDAILMNPPGDANHDYGVLAGDPVDGVFAVFLTFDRGEHWEAMKGRPRALPGEALFAASNQAAFWGLAHLSFSFVTGGVSGSRILNFEPCGNAPSRDCQSRSMRPPQPAALTVDAPLDRGWDAHPLIFPRSASGGAFAGAYAHSAGHGLAAIVGGDYSRPDQPIDTADTYRLTAGKPAWKASTVPPHGYRSSIAYDAATKTWITVGPNGTDISTDGGRNWRALKPGPADDPTADTQWNALSLPFVVGPHGRIGRLRDDALRRPHRP